MFSLAIFGLVDRCQAFQGVLPHDPFMWRRNWSTLSSLCDLRVDSFDIVRFRTLARCMFDIFDIFDRFRSVWNVLRGIGRLRSVKIGEYILYPLN
jgi:hypothetical protein